MPLIDRRTLLACGLGAGWLVTPRAHARMATRLGADALRAAALQDPLEIGDARPMLSWQVIGPPGAFQAAYRIRVASDPAMLAAGKADLWDSGRVEGGVATGVPYAGQALVSRQRCHWQVKLWSLGGESGWSAPAVWEMGLLQPADWAGEWLAVESAAERDDRLAEPRWIEAQTPDERQPGRFRLSFRSRAGEGRLTIHTASRLLRLALDGQPIEVPSWHPDAYGGPPAASFPLALTAGEHVLTAEVAARREGGKALAALAAQIRVPQADGSVRRLVDGWQVAGPDGSWPPAPMREEQGHFPWPPTPARLLRRAFRLDAAPRTARLYVAALGGYRIWINGRRVGDDELQCEPAEYRQHIPYRTYDVAPLLRAGDNVVGVLAGDGFYASYQAPDGRWAYGPAPRRLRLMIEAQAVDGAVERIATDSEWRHRQSPITLSEIYAGEDHDRRDWPQGWSAPGFDDGGWERAWSAPAPAAQLVPPLAQPIRATRIVPPLAIRRIGPRTHLIDFGQNFAGRVRLTVAGERGSLVTVRHAEILTADGMLDRRNLRVARAEDRYVLAGEARETLEPILTFQGFRYAQVDGLAELRPDMVEGVVLSSDLPEIGTFTIAEPMIQKLWLNTLWSQRSNFRGNPTDCPQRDERLGWTGDAQVFWDTAAFNMDVGGFTRSFTRMLRADQASNGAYPMWSPSPKGLGWGSSTPTPGWADAGVMLPYVSFLHNGDAAVVDDNWAAMTAYLEGILAANPDGLWKEGRGADLGDWLALDAKWPGDETTPKPLIATAMLTRSLDQMAQMAAWTGREDAPLWRRRAEATRAAFARAFVAADGIVGNGSHTGYVLALRLDLVPKELRAAAGAKLAADIRRRGTLLSTGFLGTPLALDALVDTGETALAYDLLLRTDYPSWGYMVRRGATTTWERWNSDVGDVSMNSFNHYAFGAVCSFLYRRVGGIEPVEPGFRRFRVAPAFDPRIGSAGVSLRSASGPIRLDWVRERSRVVVRLDVPANTTAELMLPGLRRTYGPGRHELTSRA
ncbi:MAG: family 78 glycoside hydrolase catalytic domain [Sphingomonas sp.]|uniref:alpha-L-rhamnosidase n=1 Tax=Sphingomonas sp. TaxID=28214 RepID=UPI0022738D46|nr:alpha-L-rhamnosidase [Sphingomonas sp.]MCX8476250.1 family 78 glycoside hydrolase catalytic domain [Sphingomonas sp.]